MSSRTAYGGVAVMATESSGTHRRLLPTLPGPGQVGGDGAHTDRKQPTPRNSSREVQQQCYSAREEHNKPIVHEDTIRAVYKKHAQAFFEDMKESFAKEVAALRRQVEQQRAPAAWSSGDGAAAAWSGAAEELREAVRELQRQVAELKARPPASAGAAQGQRREAGAAAAGKDKDGILDASLALLSARMDRQQEALRTMQGNMQREFSSAKKAVLTPMWKERALQEIAQGELRAVCADEMAKTFKDLASSFDDQQAEAALMRLADNGALPWESRLRAELEAMTEQLEAQLSRLGARCDEEAASRASLAQGLGERCHALEADLREQRQLQSAGVQRVAEHPEASSSVHKIEEQLAASLQTLSGLEERAASGARRLAELEAQTSSSMQRMEQLEESMGSRTRRLEAETSSSVQRMEQLEESMGSKTRHLEEQVARAMEGLDCLEKLDRLERRVEADAQRLEERIESSVHKLEKEVEEAKGLKVAEHSVSRDSSVVEAVEGLEAKLEEQSKLGQGRSDALEAQLRDLRQSLERAAVDAAAASKLAMGAVEAASRCEGATGQQTATLATASEVAARCEAALLQQAARQAASEELERKVVDLSSSHQVLRGQVQALDQGLSQVQQLRQSESKEVGRQVTELGSTCQTLRGQLEGLEQGVSQCQLRLAEKKESASPEPSNAQVAERLNAHLASLGDASSRAAAVLEDLQARVEALERAQAVQEAKAALQGQVESLRTDREAALEGRVEALETEHLAAREARAALGRRADDLEAQLRLAAASGAAKAPPPPAPASPPQAAAAAPEAEAPAPASASGRQPVAPQAPGSSRAPLSRKGSGRFYSKPPAPQPGEPQAGSSSPRALLRSVLESAVNDGSLVEALCHLGARSGGGGGWWCPDAEEEGAAQAAETCSKRASASTSTRPDSNLGFVSALIANEVDDLGAESEVELHSEGHDSVTPLSLRTPGCNTPDLRHDR